MPNWGHIMDEITAERKRQIEKWGDNKPPVDTMLRIIGEEFGEACQAANDDEYWNYRKELIQVAACCVKAIESFDSGVVHGNDEKIGELEKEITRLKDIIRSIRSEADEA